MQPTSNNVYQFQADKAWISFTTSTHTLIWYGPTLRAPHLHHGAHTYYWPIGSMSISREQEWNEHGRSEHSVRYRRDEVLSSCELSCDSPVPCTHQRRSEVSPWTALCHRSTCSALPKHACTHAHLNFGNLPRLLYSDFSWSLPFLQCFDTVDWVIWPLKPIPDMTHVFSGTLNQYSVSLVAKVKESV